MTARTRDEASRAFLARAFPPRRAPRTLLGVVGIALVVSVAVSQGAGCQQAPVLVSVRSLAMSGRTSFLCLDRPGASRVTRPLSECSGDQVDGVNEYLYTDDAGTIDGGVEVPHLYALVTQTKTGEVAIVDTTSYTESDLDQDPREPGANFLPVGGSPLAIVSTPGSSATFVGVQEIGRNGIFALPSSMVRPASVNAAPGMYVGGGGSNTGGAGGAPVSVHQLSSWPACSLPVAPGEILLVTDPVKAAGERPACASEPGSADPNPPYDATWTWTESPGRQKLVVALPDMGGIAVYDARRILAHKPGEYAPCEVEAWLPLKADISGWKKQQQPTSGAACVNPVATTPALADSYVPRPAGMAYADGKLYVADSQAPIIHVVEMDTPCHLSEVEPLLPTSTDDPSRVVFTDRIAVAPTASPTFQRYLYATDTIDTSVMVFDVGSGAATRTPLVRSHPELNPFMPKDRIRFGAPIADLMLVEHDLPEVHPATGVAVEGLRCDPDSKAIKCIATQPSFLCSAATLYQPSSSEGLGASPTKLRGTFAFAARRDGKLAVIDVDDFDAPCRVPASTASPSFFDAASGCYTPLAAGHDTMNGTAEMSCNAVMPHAPRSQYLISDDALSGNHVPGLVANPLLYSREGTLIDPTVASSPRMMATIGSDRTNAGLFIASSYIDLSNKDSPTWLDPRKTFTLSMNLEDPRAHTVDQNWTVTYEGPLPGFEGKSASIKTRSTDPALPSDSVVDPDSRFCALGVQSQNAAGEMLATLGGVTGQLPSAQALADYVQLTDDIPDPQSAYWTAGNGGAAGGGSCTYQFCEETFGLSITTPLRTTRDLRIVEAYQDHLEVEVRTPGAFTPPGDLGPMGTIKCCFPDSTHFTVRAGAQWVVRGDQTGFLHHVTEDASTHRCRNRCDSAASRVNGRVIEAPFPDGSTAADAGADAGTPNYWDTPNDPLQKAVGFINPMFRFSMVGPAAGSNGADGGTPTSDDTRRDMQFRFATNGSFVPLLVNLAGYSSNLILPTSLSYLAPTGELVVSDGATQGGIILVTLSNSAVSRSYN